VIHCLIKETLKGEMGDGGWKVIHWKVEIVPEREMSNGGRQRNWPPFTNKGQLPWHEMFPLNGIIHYKHHIVAEEAKEMIVALFVDHGEPEKRFFGNQREGAGEHEGLNNIMVCDANHLI